MELVFVAGVLPQERKSMFTFRPIIDRRMQLEELYIFPEEPHRFAFMNHSSEIWVVMYEQDSVDVLQFDVKLDVLAFLRRINVHENVTERKRFAIGRKKEQEVKYGINIVTDSVFGIVAACWTDKEEQSNARDLGLVLVDGNGLILETITEGKYCDVKADEECVYGFELIELKVTIHR